MERLTQTPAAEKSKTPIAPPSAPGLAARLGLLAVVRSASTTTAGVVTRKRATYSADEASAQLISWSPGKAIPAAPPILTVTRGGVETTRSALAALGAHADRHAEARAQGQPTADRPHGSTWAGRRAA